MPFTVSSSREAHGKRKRRYPKEDQSSVQASQKLGEKRHDARAKEENVCSVANRRRANLLLGVSNNAMFVRWSQGAHPFRLSQSRRGRRHSQHYVAL